MALVHERLYQSEDLARIDFDDYIKTIATELHQVFLLDRKRIELDIDAEKVQLGIDKAIPFGLIINELLSNSVKYAFPKGLRRKGKINISLKKEDGEIIELIFSDNGVGIVVIIRELNHLGYVQSGCQPSFSSIIILTKLFRGIHLYYERY